MPRSRDWADGWTAGAVAMLVLMTQGRDERWDEWRDEFLEAARRTASPNTEGE